MLVIERAQFLLLVAIYIFNVLATLALIIIAVRYKRFVRDTIYKDPLTGTYNRRYGDRTLRKIYNHEITNTFPLSIMLIDIDNFKEYNDTFGHLEGDNALKIIANKLDTCVKPNIDILFRFGGEELVIITPVTSTSDAFSKATDIVHCIGKLHETTDLKRKITISIGIATDVEEEKDFVTLLNEADQALYTAKRLGKNRACTYESIDKQIA